MVFDIDVGVDIDSDKVNNSVVEYLNSFVLDKLKKIEKKLSINSIADIEIEIIGDILDTMPVLCLPINGEVPKNYIQVDIIDNIDGVIKQEIATLFNTNKFGAQEVQLDIEALVEKYAKVDFSLVNVNTEKSLDKNKRDTTKNIGLSDAIEIEHFLNNKFPKNINLTTIPPKDYGLTMDLIDHCFRNNEKLDVNTKLIVCYVRDINKKFLIDCAIVDTPPYDISVIRDNIKILEFIYNNYNDKSILLSVGILLGQLYMLDNKFKEAIEVYRKILVENSKSTHIANYVLQAKYKACIPIAPLELFAIKQATSKFISDKNDEFMNIAEDECKKFILDNERDFLQYMGKKYANLLRQNLYSFYSIDEFLDYCKYISRVAENKLREKYGEKTLKLDSECQKYGWCLVKKD